MYNVFISYRRDGGYSMARLLYEHFKQMGAEPFFDLEELRSGPFNTKLYENIEEAKNFVVVLSAHALDRCCNEGDWLRLEIEHAILTKRNIIPVMLRGFEWPASLPESIANLPNYNGVQVSQEYFDASISRIVGMFVGMHTDTGTHVKRGSMDERIENPYFVFEDEKEKRRLEIQQNLMKSFDEGTYRKAADAFDSLYILDIGSNNGDFIMDRIGSNDKVKLLVGLEYDAASVDAANQKYGEQGRIAFFAQNVEDEDLADRLEQILAQMGAKSFNVINMSMILLHLKTPYRLLKVLRKYLAKGGMIIVKDIDDGFNVAFPDEKGEFARMVQICAANETSGYRYSGRQVYTLLTRAGYQDVCLEKMGLSTAGMDYDQRSALFDTYFSFIGEDLKIMMERYPGDQQIIEDYKWYNDCYEDLEERFQDESFFFNLGFIMYTAKKR